MPLPDRAEHCPRQDGTSDVTKSRVARAPSERNRSSNEFIPFDTPRHVSVAAALAGDLGDLDLI